MSNPKRQILIAFKKTQSLLGKIIEMIEQDRYCVDVMQQNLAAIGLLKSAQARLMENHLNTCFRRAMDSKSLTKKRKMVGEILTVNKLFNR